MQMPNIIAALSPMRASKLSLAIWHRYGQLLPQKSFTLQYPVSKTLLATTTIRECFMRHFSRRQLLRKMAMTHMGAAMLAAIPFAAKSQDNKPQEPKPQEAKTNTPFSFEDVIKRAKELNAAAFDASVPKLPEQLKNLNFDTWRDIRFKPEKSMLAAKDSPIRLQLFHLGHLYTRPVTINLIRDGIAAPIPYTASLFEYGRTILTAPLPVNTGFAGFRLHSALNKPNIFDELIAFLGASYFRLLGRDQHYGLSARGLALPSAPDVPEEFPFFKEFWVETPTANSDKATVYALLDSASVTGAYRFDIHPGAESFIDVTANLFPRRALSHIGLAPLTSMFFKSPGDMRNADPQQTVATAPDYRPQMHDSDGLLMHSGNGEWIWRPLRNAKKAEVSAFVDKDMRGFGLLQRDRAFDHYQDLDLAYERRPSYWVEPREGWGEGRIELLELPTSDETNDNIVALWTPAQTLEEGKVFAFGYRLTSLIDETKLSPNGRAVNTFITQAKANGASDAVPLGAHRIIIDFAGGDLEFYLADPAALELVPSVTHGRIIRAFLVPNPHISGFRAAIDFVADAGQPTDIRAFLRSNVHALTETWTMSYPG